MTGNGAQAAAFPDPEADPADNFRLPFQIEGLGLRGRLVRLGAVADWILTRHDYPPPVAACLAESVVLASVLAGALKYDGIFTLQTRGDGPVKFLVADVVTGGGVRGYAEFDAARMGAFCGGAVDNPVQRLLGAGHLAFTVDQGLHTDRYQGVVELSGATLSECAHHYFRQSEQLETVIRLASGRAQGPGGGQWRAAALMIQRLPGDGPMDDGGWIPGDDDAEDGWRRAAALVGTVRDTELLAPDLPAEELLHRLFHEDGVRVYRPTPHYIDCRCSRERVARILRGLSAAELDDMKIDGKWIVTCQFCNHVEIFEEAELNRSPSQAAAETR